MMYVIKGFLINEGSNLDCRLLFSNDGLLFVTYDHYETFIEIVLEEVK